MNMIRAIIIISLLVVFTTGCSVVMPIQMTGQRKPVCYSNLPFPTIRSFDRQVTIRFWGSEVDTENITVERIINEELAKTPGARGVKNLKVRVFSSSWDSFQCINCIGYMKGYLWSVFRLYVEINPGNGRYLLMKRTIIILHTPLPGST